jgi:hypothetical protein
MEDLIKEASLALSANDAETLERLVRAVRERPLGTNLAEVVRATDVLSAQVSSAHRHLDLISRKQDSVTLTYKANQWVR